MSAIDNFGIDHALEISIFCGWCFDKILKLTNFDSIWPESKNAFCIFSGLCAPSSCEVLLMSSLTKIESALQSKNTFALTE